MAGDANHHSTMWLGKVDYHGHKYFCNRIIYISRFIQHSDEDNPVELNAWAS